MKAVSQIDFIVAVGIFLIAIMFVVNYMTNFIVPLKDISDSQNLRARAMGIMEAAEHEDAVLSLYTTAYKTKIKLENSHEFLINKSHAIVDLRQEAVKLNLSSINFTNIDKYSVVVYNDSQRTALIENDIVNDIVVFNSSIMSGEIKFFFIYFDDDSSFPDTTKTINVTNELNEIVYPVESIHVLQYRKINSLSITNYSYLREIAGGYFRIEIEDRVNGDKYVIGPEAPTRGDVVVLEKSAIMQNSIANVHDAVMRIFVW